MKRDEHSSKDGFYTHRVTNERVDQDVNSTAMVIARLARDRYRRIKEEEKKHTFTGVVKTVLKKMSEEIDRYQDDDDYL